MQKNGLFPESSNMTSFLFNLFDRHNQQNTFNYYKSNNIKIFDSNIYFILFQYHPQMSIMYFYHKKLLWSEIL